MRVSPGHFEGRIAREGIPFVTLALLFLLLCLALFRGWGLVSVLLPAFVLNFFRNPRRSVPEGKDLILSPADGKIVKSEQDPGTGRWKVGIFMNVFDVHLNRIPVTGTVESIEYIPGAFFNADMDKASERNERNVLILSTERGDRISMTQVAGLVARRIVCYAEPSDRLEAGTLFGLIRFGSRVDLDLPERTSVRVRLGDRVKGGESIIGTFSE